jgi:hypothetical protein
MTRSYTPEEFRDYIKADEDLYDRLCKKADELGMKLVSWDGDGPRIFWADFEAMVAACLKAGMPLGGDEDNPIRR